MRQNAVIVKIYLAQGAINKFITHTKGDPHGRL